MEVGRGEVVIKPVCVPPVKHKPHNSEQGKWSRRVKRDAVTLMLPRWQWWEGLAPHSRLLAVWPSRPEGMLAMKFYSYGGFNCQEPQQHSNRPLSMTLAPPPHAHIHTHTPPQPLLHPSLFWFISPRPVDKSCFLYGYLIVLTQVWPQRKSALIKRKGK